MWYLFKTPSVIKKEYFAVKKQSVLFCFVFPCSEEINGLHSGPLSELRKKCHWEEETSLSGTKQVPYEAARCWDQSNTAQNLTEEVTAL